ncbi:MAG: 3-deoxy-D-manno-octulosonic acid transferase [Deltaproteobacteria bacterium]|nr:3-deoxy-D-manno-octulosonic acid transferase [Deltaproteobacteria bacterium]
MLTLIYHFLWTLIFAFCAPIGLLLRNRRLLERLALKLSPELLGRGNIWIHALSVGEVISALPLVKALSQKYPDRDIVFTVTTVKGMAIAREELKGKVKALITMPFDSWFCIRRMVRHIRPSVFILVETDIWPALTGYLRKKGIKAILINGRVSPRTFKSYRRFPFFARKMFEPLEFCLMQSDLDRERLLQSGIDFPRKVVTVGNIKFDREWTAMDDRERKDWLNRLRLESGDVVWVAGSTHPGEEEILLNVHKRLCEIYASIRFIIAPRRIERSDEVLRLAQSKGLKSCLKSELSRDGGRNYDVLILNTIGELGRVYGLSKVSFVGGSLVPFGGHNLLEPAIFGCPVIFGQHMHNFVLMSELLLEAGGGWRVLDGEALYEAMDKLLADSETRNRMGGLAKEFVEKNQGALFRVLSYIGDSTNGIGGLK